MGKKAKDISNQIIDRKRLQETICRRDLDDLERKWDEVELLWSVVKLLKGRKRKELEKLAKIMEEAYFVAGCGMIPIPLKLEAEHAEHCAKVCRDRLARGLTTPEDPVLYRMLVEGEL